MADVVLTQAPADERPEEEYPEPTLLTDGVWTHGSRDRGNIWYISEDPHVRLINWGHTRLFRLPLPYMHYKVEYYPNIAEGVFWLWGAYMSPWSLDDARNVSFPILPNFYRERPCFGPMKEQQFTSPIALLNGFWSERFNQEGNLAYHLVWRQLVQRAGTTTRHRLPVLEYWETLTVEEICEGFTWPPHSFLD